MRNIIRTALICMLAAAGMVSCEENLDLQKVEYPDLGPRIELVYKDGGYIPKSDQIPEGVFARYSQGTWKLTAIKNVSVSGKLTDVTFAYSDGNVYPFFSLRENGMVRQFIDTPDKKTYADGTYSYDQSANMLHFHGVVPQHPEFRLFRLTESEMHGSFAGPENDSENSVITLYVYKKLSYEDEVGLDIIFGAE